MVTWLISQMILWIDSKQFRNKPIKSSDLQIFSQKLYYPKCFKGNMLRILSKYLIAGQRLLDVDDSAGLDQLFGKLLRVLRFDLTFSENIYNSENK